MSSQPFSDRSHDSSRDLRIDQVSTQALLSAVATGVSAATGDSFFQSLVLYLSQTLGMPIAYVGRVRSSGPIEIELVALAVDGNLAPNFTYAPDNSPCATVLSDDMCAIETGVRDRYPANPYLEQLAADSYMGIALRSSGDELLGLLAVMGREPIRDLGKTESLVKIFAARAAAELERRRTDQALRDSETMLRLVLNAIPACVFWKNSDGVYLGCNDHFIRDIEVASRDDILGRTDAELGLGLPADLLSVDEQTIFDRGESLLNKEVRHPMRDGGERWLRVNKMPLPDSNGRIVGLLVSYEDISDQKRAHLELSESRERVRFLASATSEGIVIHDNGRILEINESGARGLGLSAQELAGRSVMDFVHPDFHQQVVERMADGDESPYEVIGLRHDGSPFPVEVRARQANLDERKLRVVVLRDLSDRHEAERALRESEENLRLLADNTNDGILVNMQGRHVFANRRIAQLLGYTIAELLETDVATLVAPDQLPIVQDRSRRRLAGEVVPNQYETVLLSKTGEYIPVEITAAITRWKGQPAGLISVRDIRERKRVEATLMTALQDLERAHEQIAAIIDNAPAVAMQGFDAEGRVTFWNPASEQLYGFRAEQIIGKHLGGLVLSEADGVEFEAILRQVLSTGISPPLREWQVLTRDGEMRWVMSSMFVIRFGRDQAQTICMDVDITERIRSEQHTHKLSSVVQQTADAVIITDHLGVIEYVNPAFEEITGYDRTEAIGKTPALIKSGRHDKNFYRELWDTIRGGNVYRNVLINRKKDGSVYYEEKTITPLRNVDGKITHYVSTAKDITERMHTQERLQYLAYHDALTELPNRVLLMDRLEHALSRVRWTGRQLAVLFLDLDRFKVINDTLGHDFGDRLLQVVAQRLRRCVREGDTVSRVSGDEFAILLEDMASTEDVVLVARKLLDTFGQPFEVFRRELFVTTSIGISVCPTDGTDAPTLLKNADTAMYRAKERGRNIYQFYSADMSAKAVELLALETGLRRALERNELILHYQPTVDLRSGQIVGAEALLRWNHRELGLIYPAEFIPLLEETGLISPVGDWVLENACIEAQRWQARHGRPLRVAVNLSANQFNSPEITEKVSQALRVSGLDPSLLELEITESVIMKHAQQTIDTLSALGEMGIRFAIDDFGTGYSSLSYLKRFPIHSLKIDKSFVKDIPGDLDDSAIITTVVAMAHNLKLEVVAEGVETEQQVAFLRACGCDAIQGYQFSRPVSADEFMSMLGPDPAG